MTEKTDPPLPDDDYFLEIEAHFAARRGTPFILSAKDWSLMKSWKDDGVPLPVVIEAVDSCFDKNQQSGRRRTISSLSYCRHAVRDLWEERKDLAIGGSEALPEIDSTVQIEDLASSLTELAATAGSSATAALLQAGEAVTEAARTRSVPKLEERLAEIEETLIEQLLSALTPEERQDLEREVDTELARYPIKDDDTRRRTREANLRRMVRRRFSLPRLSLFS